MDETTASYYRAILFRDSQDQRNLPPTLVRVHQWAFKTFQRLGLGGIISKATALQVAMMWLTNTQAGREFAREHLPDIGELFIAAEQEVIAAPDKDIDWNSVPAESKVVVSVNDAPVVGEFLGRRGSWLDVRVEGDERKFRSNQVQLAGA